MLFNPKHKTVTLLSFPSLTYCIYIQSIQYGIQKSLYKTIVAVITDMIIFGENLKGSNASVSHIEQGV
jgi:hypothetical protein